MADKPKIRPLNVIIMLAVGGVIYARCRSGSDTKPDVPSWAREPAVPPPTTASSTNGVGCEPAANPVYRIHAHEDVSYPGHPRSNVRISVPKGLSRESLTANLCHAALFAAQEARASRPAITVFAYKSEDTKGVYTAGRATYAPYGDWSKADPTVRLSDWKIVIDLEESYFTAK